MREKRAKGAFETTAAREQAAAPDTFAKTTRSTEHGMRGFYIRADFATIARIDATVAYLAKALLAMGDTSSLDTRRVKAVLIMANPTQAVQILHAYTTWHRDNTTEPDPDPDAGEEGCTAGPGTPTGQAPVLTPQRFDPTTAAELLDETKLLPTVWLFAHLAGLPDHPDHADRADNPVAPVAPVARVEGAGPVSTEWVRTHLGPRCRFKITPVLDPLDQVPVDAYEIPHRHRHAVALLTPADIYRSRPTPPAASRSTTPSPGPSNAPQPVSSSPGSGTTAR